MEDLTVAKLLSNIANAAITIAVGGWTYMQFILFRKAFPKAALSHLVEWRSLDKDWQLVRVTLNIENRSEVLLELDNCSIDLLDFGSSQSSALIELGKKQMADIEAGREVMAGNAHGLEFPWQALRKINSVLDSENSKNCKELEPGEKDEMHYDFVIDSTIDSVLVSSHVSNKFKLTGNPVVCLTQKEIGWNLTTPHYRNEYSQFKSATTKSTAASAGNPGA